MDKKICAKLTCIQLLLTKVEILIDEIKTEIGATPEKIDLIYAETPLSINYPREEKQSINGQINGSNEIKEI